MEFILTTSAIKNHLPINEFYERLKSTIAGRQGCVYYKFPIAGGSMAHIPDITVVDKDYGVCIFDFYPYVSLDDIQQVGGDEWTIKGNNEDSPVLKLEDYATNLRSKYERYRPLRGNVKVNYYAVFPQFKRREFTAKFSDYEVIEHCKFSDELAGAYETFWSDKSYFDEQQLKDLFYSVSQGAGRLNNYKRLIAGAKSNVIGEAIELIDTKISYLDQQQHAAAVQIPDGPQRIRGMAGTGKTIILTMKAAFLHSLYPEKKILYCFNTQSLYNQVRDLITKFYRETEEKDPNWNNLLVLHAWGGKAKEGVYSRACNRNSIPFIPLMTARAYSRQDELNYVCLDAMKHQILEEYDYVLMDEAQDFPPSFFQLVYRLTKEPKRIIFAYDELQSLNKLAIQDTGDLFGYNSDGTKKVDFSQGVYEGGIEMDFILNKSYRNPLPVLMTAHSIGLGVYNIEGVMQTIEDRNVWKAIGYEVVRGNLTKTDDEIEILRPIENSISLAHDIYEGNRNCLEYIALQSRDEEIQWIVNQIQNDIQNEKVLPHDIMVISINQTQIEKYFIPLQQKLFNLGIASIIPGVGGVDRDKFGEKGFVTLSTVYKAKGNESFIVYVMAFDYLYDYVEFVFARNRAFTSISRSKGWCRISGIGGDMDRAIQEIQRTQENIPRFRFKVPDPEKVSRKLGQEEHAMRLLEQKKGVKAITDLLGLDEKAIKLTDEEKEILKKKLGL